MAFPQKTLRIQILMAVKRKRRKGCLFPRYVSQPRIFEAHHNMHSGVDLSLLSLETWSPLLWLFFSMCIWEAEI